MFKFFGKRTNGKRLRAASPLHKRCNFEALESRIVLAVASGNVDAFVRGGDLIVRGDQFDNDLHLIAGSTEGEFFLHGGNGTMVNGGTDQIGLQGITGSFKLNFKKGGNNVVKIGDVENGEPGGGDPGDGPGGEPGDGDGPGAENRPIGGDVHVPNKLIFNGGNGNDELVIDTVHIGDDLRIFTRNGADTLTLGNSDVHDDVTIRTSTGDDELGIGGLTVGDDLNVGTGMGGDLLHLFASAVGDNAMFGTGLGTDLITIDGLLNEGDLTIMNPGGDDDIGVLNVDVFGSTWVVGGPGKETLAIENVDVDHDLNINTDGGGDDMTEIVGPNIGGDLHFQSTVGNNTLIVRPIDDEVGPVPSPFIGGSIHARFGPGNDIVFFDGVLIGADVDVRVSGGDDDIDLHQVQIEGDLNVYGGAGLNEIDLFGVQSNNLWIMGGRHVDTINVTNAQVNHSTWIRTGKDDDQVTIDALHTNDFNIGLGRGDDHISVTQTFVQQGWLNGGRGFDELTIDHLQDTRLISIEEVIDLHLP
jgi:hypothetical protein